MKQPTQIFPIKIHAYSGLSREKAVYSVGRPDWAKMQNLSISANEAREIMTNLPPELLEIVKDHYGLVKLTDNVLRDNTITTDDISSLTSEDQVVTVEEGIALEEMTRDELRQLCKQLEITGYSSWSKEKLIEAIEKVALESDDE